MTASSYIQCTFRAAAKQLNGGHNIPDTMRLQRRIALDINIPNIDVPKE